MLTACLAPPRPSLQRAVSDAAPTIARCVLKPDGVAYISEPIYAGAFNDILKMFHDEREVRQAAEQGLEIAPEDEDCLNLRALGVEINTDQVSMTVDEYVRIQNVAGLIVVKNGTVVYERYELGNTR